MLLRWTLPSNGSAPRETFSYFSVDRFCHGLYRRLWHSRGNFLSSARLDQRSLRPIGDVRFYGRNQEQSGHRLVRCKCPLLGVKQTWPFAGNPLSRSLLRVKRTSAVALHMSAYDPKRTSIGDQLRMSEPPIGRGLPQNQRRLRSGSELPNANLVTAITVPTRKRPYYSKLKKEAAMRQTVLTAVVATLLITSALTQQRHFFDNRRALEQGWSVAQCRTI